MAAAVSYFIWFHHMLYWKEYSASTYYNSVNHLYIQPEDIILFWYFSELALTLSKQRKLFLVQLPKKQKSKFPSGAQCRSKTFYKKKKFPTDQKWPQCFGKETTGYLQSGHTVLLFVTEVYPRKLSWCSFFQLFPTPGVKSRRSLYHTDKALFEVFFYSTFFSCFFFLKRKAKLCRKFEENKHCIQENGC